MYTAMSQTGRLLKEFKKHGKLTNAYMVRTLNIFRHSARIAELRQEGKVIACTRVKEGLFEYTYIPDEEADLAEALDIITSEEYQEIVRYNTEKMAKEWL